MDTKTVRGRKINSAQKRWHGPEKVFHPLTEDLLLSQSKLRPGDYYSKDKADADVVLMQAAYGNRGYGVTVREHDFATGTGEVAVHYEVQEKPPAKVGQIYIVGNDVTRQNVILRQIPLYPGQILTYPDLRLAEKNLAKLGIFETNGQTGVRPTVSVMDIDSDTEFKDILVQVQEQPTGSLIFGVGVNSDAGLTGSIVLFDSQFSLGLSAYYWDRVYNEYTEDRLGMRAVLSRRINQYWSASVTGRIEDVGIHNIQYDEPFVIQETESQHFLSSIRLGVTRDTRDSYLRATEGSVLDLSFEQFFGDYTFPQLNLEFSKFWTVYERADLSGRHVLALHSQVGWTSSEAPVFEKFYAGGFRSMRGFEFRGVGPAIDGYKVGGDFLLLNSLEYQVPILANDNLYAVFFCDTGTVEEEVEIKDYRVSVGMGLRIVVPMMGPVPIALDVGFPIVRGPNDNEQVFSFWVGFFH